METNHGNHLFRLPSEVPLDGGHLLPVGQSEIPWQVEVLPPARVRDRAVTVVRRKLERPGT